MLKKIATRDVELGMFVHKLNGSWFSHPFWRSRFLLEDPDLLAQLQSSDVDSVTIDTGKGFDLRPAPRPSPPPKSNAAAPLRAPAIVQRQIFPPRKIVAAREFGTARVIAGQAQKAVSRIFLEARLGKGIKAKAVEVAVNEIFHSIQRNPHAFNGLMRCKRNNEYVYRHALAVCAMMIMLARRLKLPAEQVREAGMAGMLLDIGIGSLPIDLGAYGGDYRNIPHKIFVSHVELGHSQLAIGGDIPPAVLTACLNHHEAMDGTGYPRQIKSPNIDLFSRMAAICDTYDALVSDTAEGVGMNPSSALQQLQLMTAWFDPEVLKHFVEMLGLYPTGSVVKLQSGRLAMVYDQDPDAPELPRVRTFFNIEKDCLIRGRNIDLAHARGEDRIVYSAEPEDFGIVDFATLREKIFNLATRNLA